MTIARLRQWWADLRSSFWMRPAVMTVLAIGLAIGLIKAEDAFSLPSWLQSVIYSGATTGARDVLGAIATATIGVAGTMFSITVAALTLASNQMGPRLLRNFTRDPGNQYALGVLVATFAFALITLRSVEDNNGTPFVPQLAVTGALALSMLCIGIVIWFLQHLATSINVDHVIALVYDDLRRVLEALPEAASAPHQIGPSDLPAEPGAALAASGSGYVLVLDDDTLADWAHENAAVLALNIRPGDFVFPRQTIGMVWPPDLADKAQAIVGRGVALSSARDVEQDIEFAVDKLVEIGLRALSPGINDPFSAIAVLDRLGAALCLLAGKHLPEGRRVRDGRLCLLRPATRYAGLTDAMFHMIRQAAGTLPSVMIRIQEVLCAVVRAEQDEQRQTELRRHAALVRDAALGALYNEATRLAVSDRHAKIIAALEHAPGPDRSDVLVRCSGSR